MTPQEKAIELVHKYNNNDHLYYSITIGQAKICALIAVDEILDEPTEFDFEYWFDKSTGHTLSYKEYYSEVKEEIEKI